MAKAAAIGFKEFRTPGGKTARAALGKSAGRHIGKAFF